jgi:hypothetical protein
MTRITKYERSTILHSIMKGLPNKNYVADIHTLMQDTIVEFMPVEVRAMYYDPVLRSYLAKCRLDVSSGNAYVPMYHGSNNFDVIVGVTASIKVRLDDADSIGRMPEGSLYRALVTRLANSGLVPAYFAQEELRRDVEKRLRANLDAATTIKKLYAVLEPELHQYIPRDTPTSSLPACVAPVVDDLRKLGANLPATPKAVG